MTNQPTTNQLIKLLDTNKDPLLDVTTEQFKKYVKQINKRCICLYPKESNTNGTNIKYLNFAITQNNNGFNLALRKDRNIIAFLDISKIQCFIVFYSVNNHSKRTDIITLYSKAVNGSNIKHTLIFNDVPLDTCQLYI